MEHTYWKQIFIAFLSSLSFMEPMTIYIVLLFPLLFSQWSCDKN